MLVEAVPESAAVAMVVVIAVVVVAWCGLRLSIRYRRNLRADSQGLGVGLNAELRRGKEGLNVVIIEAKAL